MNELKSIRSSTVKFRENTRREKGNRTIYLVTENHKSLPSIDQWYTDVRVTIPIVFGVIHFQKTT